MYVMLKSVEQMLNDPRLVYKCDDGRWVYSYGMGGDVLKEILGKKRRVDRRSDLDLYGFTDLDTATLIPRWVVEEVYED
jgi:hypothetical protein